MPQADDERPLQTLAKSTVFSGAILTGMGLFADVIAVEWRFLIIVFALLLGALGIWATRRLRVLATQDKTSNEKLSLELREATRQIGLFAPERTLDGLSHALFRGPGVWRLSVYVVFEHSSGDWWLRRVLRRSGSDQYESSGRPEIPLAYSVLRELPNVNLSSPFEPYANQSGAFPDRERAPEEWYDQQAKIVTAAHAAKLTMPTRKYAWCATRDDETRVTVALVAESVDTEGINVDLLRSPLVRPWLTMMARAAELTELAQPVSDAALRLKDN